MRRAILAVTLGGVLLSGTACSGDGDAAAGGPGTTTPPVTPAAAPSSAAPDHSADTRKVCKQVNRTIDRDLDAFGGDIGRMIAFKEAKLTDEAAEQRKIAVKRLKAVAATIGEQTADAQDPTLRSAGAASAARLRTSAADSDFFDALRSEKDLNRVLGEQLGDWITPVVGACAQVAENPSGESRTPDASPSASPSA